MFIVSHSYRWHRLNLYDQIYQLYLLDEFYLYRVPLTVLVVHPLWEYSLMGIKVKGDK